MSFTAPPRSAAALDAAHAEAAAPDWAAVLAQVCAEPETVGVAFQPIVDLGRATVAGYEALARFPGPPDATPDVWFGEADRHGLAFAFEAAVLTRTLAARSATPSNCFLSINVSPHALLSDEVQAVLGPADLTATVIEVTEQAAVDDYDVLLDALERLRAHGAMIAVDDAGAGHASLSHVMRLRPEIVKLDRGFVTDCDTDPVKLAGIEMLGAFAGRIDAWVIAEGLERREEVGELLRLGVPLGQGYFLGRPSPVMDPLREEVAGPLRADAAARRRLGRVGALVEPAPAVCEEGSARRAAEVLLADPRHRTIVTVDERHRPVGLILRDDRRAGPRPLMTVGAGDEVRDLARRAMTRPPWRRFDPLVCCDSRGRYAGIVRVERLVDALAADADAG